MAMAASQLGRARLLCAGGRPAFLFSDQVVDRSAERQRPKAAGKNQSDPRPIRRDRRRRCSELSTQGERLGAPGVRAFEPLGDSQWLSSPRVCESGGARRHRYAGLERWSGPNISNRPSILARRPHRGKHFNHPRRRYDGNSRPRQQDHFFTACSRHGRSEASLASRHAVSAGLGSNVGMAQANVLVRLNTQQFVGRATAAPTNKGPQVELSLRFLAPFLGLATGAVATVRTTRRGVSVVMLKPQKELPDLRREGVQKFRARCPGVTVLSHLQLDGEVVERLGQKSAAVPMRHMPSTTGPHTLVSATLGHADLKTTCVCPCAAGREFQPLPKTK